MSHEGIRFASQEEKAREDEQNRPLSRAALTPEKVRVLLTEGKGLEIDWNDGHKSAWSFAWLRNGCPCATCVEEREQQGRKPGEAKRQTPQLLPMYTPPPKPSSVLPVGRYALQFHWQDGHSSGIYSWEYLRRNCQCSECTFAAARPAGAPN
jgi:DUF971 family protein